MDFGRLSLPTPKQKKNRHIYSFCLNTGVRTMADMDSSTFPQGLRDGLQSTRYSRGSKVLTLPILTWHIKTSGIDYLNNVLFQKCCNQRPTSVRVWPRIMFLSVCSIRIKPKPSVFSALPSTQATCHKRICRRDSIAGFDKHLQKRATYQEVCYCVSTKILLVS